MSATAPPLPENLPKEGIYANVETGSAPDFCPAAPPQHPYEAYKPQQLASETVQAMINQWGKENIGCCTSTTALDTMQVVGYTTGAAYDYKFESFTESRSLHQVSCPHAPFAPVDGPQNGPAPTMWQMVVPKQPDFHVGTGKYEVPHTAMVAICHNCIGMGRVTCNMCHGRGRRDCISCNRRGYKDCI